MDCREFERRVREHLERRVPATAWDEAWAHRRSCAACRARTPHLDTPERTTDEEETFIHGVLARTSGTACEQAEIQLDEFLDDKLAAIDAELVGGHLEHCGPCRQLARTMAELRQPLRAMATIDPGPAFTAAVLQATSGAVSVAVTVADEEAEAANRSLTRATIWTAGLLQRFQHTWHSFVASPRFTIEAAYVATVIMVLLFGTPLSPFRSATQQALALAEINPVQTAATLVRDVAAERGPSIWGPLATRVSQSAVVTWPRQQAELVSIRWQGAHVAVVDFGRHGAGLGRAVWRGDETTAAQELERMAANLVELRQSLSAGHPTEENESETNASTANENE